MAIEEAIEKDASLTAAELERLIRELEAWYERGELGDEEPAVTEAGYGPKQVPAWNGMTAEPRST